ncbi:Os10g0534600 [Oryza sativa Japonica Group]|uniref:Os10g0534600 protein n=1 Tax=Oryza sativa subsp. japonica TaxID=39947 RepID=Q0IW39_ORYSJ|nr:Os10g0534600 [Oryza sativa Japonica Group]|eukprot:NP_001065162.1 Os10g0534600 [Oryza sativa Japonica Group]
MSETRWRWRMLESTRISVWNSGNPCLDARLARFTATRVPSRSTPRYTFPNPPTPRMFASSKSPVATMISASGMWSFMFILRGVTTALPNEPSPSGVNGDHGVPTLSFSSSSGTGSVARRCLRRTSSTHNATPARTAAPSTAAVTATTTTLLVLPDELAGVISTALSFMISSPFSIAFLLSLLAALPMLTVRFSPAVGTTAT